MSVVELKDSDSSDNDVFVVKQIKPVNKITFPEALLIKYRVLNSVSTKKNKKKKDKKIKKRSTDSDDKKPKNKKIQAKGENCQKQSSKSISISDIKNEDQTRSERKFFSKWIKKNAKDAEKIINLNIKKESIICNSDELESANMTENYEVSEFFSGCRKRNIENCDLSPGISREKKKLKAVDPFIKLIQPLPKNKKPLKRLFDLVENDTFSAGKKCKNHDVNKTEMESSNELLTNISENINPEKDLEINLRNFVTSESTLEKFFSFGEFKFQNNLQETGMEINAEKNSEIFKNCSELLCFLFKKIISDETKKQIELEKQSFRKDKVVEKLLSKSECKILEKFFIIEPNACQLFVRMLGRKIDWHRISSVNYKDIGDNLESEFELLHKKNFIDINIENEDLKTQMHLLSRMEILKLCKTFNVFLKSVTKYKKESLINSLIEDSKRQKNALDMLKKRNSTSRLDLLKSEVKNILGMCVRVNDEIFQVFHKILLLFSFPHYYDEEKTRFKNELFLCYQVHKNIIKFPNYTLSPTIVFETRADFEEYKKSLLLQENFEMAVRNKNYDAFISAFSEAKNKFKELNKNHEYQIRFLNLKPFLQKFSAGTVYARILTKFCKTFKKKSDNSEIISTAQLLLNQNLFLLGKKGEWYEILSKAFEVLKQNNAAAEVIIQSLNDPLINEVQKLTLQLRGLYILKKKTFGINDNLREVLDDMCTLSVQDPPSIEIKGKALEGNESGFKSVYVQNFHDGKMFTSVEERAISYYKSNGFTKGYHTEGSIVQTLYFIIFFDIIYGLSPEGVFQTPYQESPLDLFSSSFYFNRKEDIDLLMSDLLVWDDKQIETKIKDVYYKNYGTNCVIKWNDDFTPELYCEIIRCITMPVLVRLFQRFIKNFKVARSGFPDLTLWNPETNKCKFVEVKSPNDKLSPAQRIWLDYLRNIGLDCEICNVKNTSSKCCG